MIERRVFLPAPPDRVWTELTDPDALADWLGSEVDWELVPGGAAHFDGPGGERRSGRVEEVRPGRRLRWRWWPDAGDGPASEVECDLDAEEDGTRLTVREQVVVAAPPGPASPATPVATASVALDAGDRSATWTAWDSHLVGLWARAVGCGAGVRC